MPSSLNTQLSRYFTLHEGIYLPQYKREATADDGLSDEILNNLRALFAKVDLVREFLNSPFHVHCAYRSPAYNQLVGGAPNSAHMRGMAVDFDVSGIDCDAVRQKILDQGLLDKLGLRMEKKPGSDWVHLDSAPVVSNRYFIP